MTAGQLAPVLSRGFLQGPVHSQRKGKSIGVQVEPHRPDALRDDWRMRQALICVLLDLTRTRTDPSPSPDLTQTLLIGRSQVAKAGGLSWQSGDHNIRNGVLGLGQGSPKSEDYYSIPSTGSMTP